MLQALKMQLTISTVASGPPFLSHSLSLHEVTAEHQTLQLPLPKASMGHLCREHGLFPVLQKQQNPSSWHALIPCLPLQLKHQLPFSGPSLSYMCMEHPRRLLSIT